MEQPLSERASLPDLTPYVVMYTVEDPWNSNENGRSDFAQILDEARKLVVDCDRTAHADQSVKLAGLAERMCPGQEGKRAVLRAQGERLPRRLQEIQA